MINPEIEFLQKLVAIPSITPVDGGCLDLIINQLSPSGFVCEKINSATVSNLWAYHGNFSADEPLTCFIGHIDVVPTGPLAKWDNPPFSPIIKDGFLYGRGSADMKGGISAMVLSAKQFVQENPNHRGTIAMIVTSDEEAAAIEGTDLVLKKLVEKKIKFDYGIVAEPTCREKFGDTIKVGRRGSLSACLQIIGKQGHVAYPDKSINAVHVFAAALKDIVGEKWDEGNEDFPPTTFQISNVSAGTGATNVIPGEMKIDFNFRHGTVSSTESLKSRFENILKKHNLQYQLSWYDASNPYLTTKRNLSKIVGEVVKNHTKVEAELNTSGGTSDGRFLAKYCEEVIEFGNLNHTIHQINEKVNVDDVVTLRKIFYDVLKKIYG